MGLAGVLLVIAGGLQAADLDVDASAAAALSAAQRADLARRVEAIVASVREVLPTLPDDVVVEVRALDGAVCEGMATAFARDHADAEQPWASYPPEVAAWYEEVKDLPASATTGGWMFFHDDGWTWIGYKVGTWLVDRAMRASGRSAAELTRVPTGQIVQLARY